MSNDTERHEAALLTPDEAALRLRVKPSTVKRWARQGTIPAKKIGRGWLIPTEWVEQQEAA